MTPTFAQRAVWLAGITLVAAVGAVALIHRDSNGASELPSGRPVRGTPTGFYKARAAPYGPTRSHSRTWCGRPFTKNTEGVAHPTLPCGVKIYVRYNGREVLTVVVDRGPNVPGRDLDITKALADKLDLHGTQTVYWRFAG